MPKLALMTMYKAHFKTLARLITINLCKTPSGLWWYIIWPRQLCIISSEIRIDTDACLAITEAICGIQMKNHTKNWIYSPLKIDVGLGNHVPSSIFSQRISPYIARNIYRIASAKIRFFPSTTIKRNNLY